MKRFAIRLDLIVTAESMADASSAITDLDQWDDIGVHGMAIQQLADEPEEPKE